jgi:hypothetical protein
VQKQGRNYFCGKENANQRQNGKGKNGKVSCGLAREFALKFKVGEPRRHEDTKKTNEI